MINTMDRIKVGIVGTGFMAVAHIRAYHQVDGAEIAALCNPSGRHLDGDFSDVHSNVGSDEPVKLDMTNIAAYRGLEKMLADASINLIDITTPTFLHREQTLAALTAGKHVLCEARMAMNFSESQQMLETSRENSSLISQLVPAPFTLHSDKTIRSYIDEDRLGKIL